MPSGSYTQISPENLTLTLKSAAPLPISLFAAQRNLFG